MYNGAKETGVSESFTKKKPYEKRESFVKREPYIKKEPVRERPLLLQACMGGAFGRLISEEGAKIYEAGFIYLDGTVNMDLLKRHIEEYKNRMFICLSTEWEKSFLDEYPDTYKTTRYQMKHRHAMQAVMEQAIEALPTDYQLVEFTREIFDKHPFKHGRNYASYENFTRHGVGNVILYDGEIVASASSFLSYKNAVELDVSTIPEHRKKGLALACCADMLLKASKKGFDVHWDAQNKVSFHIAQKLGYQLDYKYTAYSFVKVVL